MWLGGCPNGTRLAEVYAERVKVKDFETFFEPLFALFKAQRRGEGESFGDFAARLGPAALRAQQASYIGAEAALKLPRVRWVWGEWVSAGLLKGGCHTISRLPCSADLSDPPLARMLPRQLAIFPRIAHDESNNPRILPPPLLAGLDLP